LLPQLNFPQYNFRIRKREKLGHEIFDRVRKKFVMLTPEEWVRQHLLEFMITEKKFPLSLLAVEKQLKLNNTIKRTDVMAYNNAVQPVLIAECKAPEITLDLGTLRQAMRYNLVHNVPHLIITNGRDHFFFCRKNISSPWEQQQQFPDYQELLKAI
jgi:hypothetical protein